MAVFHLLLQALAHSIRLFGRVRFANIARFHLRRHGVKIDGRCSLSPFPRRQDHPEQTARGQPHAQIGEIGGELRALPHHQRVTDDAQRHIQQPDACAAHSSAALPRAHGRGHARKDGHELHHLVDGGNRAVAGVPPVQNQREDRHADDRDRRRNEHAAQHGENRAPLRLSRASARRSLERADAAIGCKRLIFHFLPRFPHKNRPVTVQAMTGRLCL